MALRLTLDQRPTGVTAYYLKVWLEGELEDLGRCPWEEDLRYARETCDQLGVPLEVVSLQREYHQRIVSYTLSELEAGRTPSPDVLCNPEIKMGAFLERCGGGDTEVVTGHYARRLDEGGLTFLGRAADAAKDQTYFLCLLTQSQLQRCRFPLGGYLKAEVRALAAEWVLPARHRPDSQGICFLGRIGYPEFVRRCLGEKRGEIRLKGTGEVLGFHRGHWFYTLGQRQGLGLAGGPFFVVAKHPVENVVEVVHGDDLLPSSPRAFFVASPHWVAGPPRGGQVEVKVRHSPRSRPCRLGEDGGDLLRVELEESDPGIAPGQFAVFYQGPLCLGGGAVASVTSDPASSVPS